MPAEKLNIFVRSKLIDAEKSGEIIVDILYWIKYNMDKYKTRHADHTDSDCFEEMFSWPG